MKKIALILSGCGFKDGSEITEAVSSLIALSEFGAKYEIFAPDIDKAAVNHIDGSVDEERNILVESARLARGQIKSLATLDVTDFDALFFPGGFGAALNLCSWGQAGAKCAVHPEVEKAILDFYKQQKPIGAVCIAPALLARVLGTHKITLTIGDDPATASEIEKTGAHHESCRVTDYVTDREHKIVTSPAYMYGSAKPFEVFTGVRLAIKELVEMA